MFHRDVMCMRRDDSRSHRPYTDRVNQLPFLIDRESRTCSRRHKYHFTLQRIGQHSMTEGRVHLFRMGVLLPAIVPGLTSHSQHTNVKRPRQTFLVIQNTRLERTVLDDIFLKCYCTLRLR